MRRPHEGHTRFGRLDSSARFFMPANAIVKATAITRAERVIGSRIIRFGPRLPHSTLRMGVCPKIQLSTPAVGYVRVELRRAEVGVAQHLLHAAQVRAALEQVGGEGVAEQVRMDPARGEARPLGGGGAGEGSPR